MDVDCVDNEIMLIVERDAAEVIVPVGVVLEEGLFEEEMLEAVPMGIVPMTVEAVSVRGYPTMTVPLVEELVMVGVMTEGPLLERRLNEALVMLAEEPVFIFIEMTVELMLDDTEDKEPELEEPLGVAELEKTMLLT